MNRKSAMYWRFCLKIYHASMPLHGASAALTRLLGSPPKSVNCASLTAKACPALPMQRRKNRARNPGPSTRSEEHTSELQSLMRISYDVFCLKKKKHTSKTLRNTKNMTQI